MFSAAELKACFEHNNGARIAYKRTTDLGRRNIEKILLAPRHNGFLIEHCGRSFRAFLTATSKYSVSLSGADTALSAICWYPEAKPATPKRTRDSISTIDTLTPIDLDNVSMSSSDTIDDPMLDVYAEGLGLPSQSKSRRKAGKPTKDKTVRFDDGRVYYGRDGGLKHGSDVHQEIEHFIIWTSERFNATHPRVDPMTKAVLCRLGTLGLMGIGAEVKVGNLKLGIATAVDGVALNSKGELVTFETKTGSRGFFTLPSRSHPNMKAPFDGLEESLLNRARLQLLFGTLLLEYQCGVTVAESYVLYAESSDPNIEAIAFDLGPVATYRNTLSIALQTWRNIPHHVAAWDIASALSSEDKNIMSVSASTRKQPLSMSELFAYSGI